MAFNIFTTQRVFRFGQYDRIDDLTSFKLRGNKSPIHQQFLVDEFQVAANTDSVQSGAVSRNGVVLFCPNEKE
jgi:hypothetical protein